MLCIHQTFCISPQDTLTPNGIDELKESVNNKLYAIEPSYEGIPVNILRRMGKAVRMGVGAAMPLLQKKDTGPLNGIIIGTAMGGMEGCISFLNQIMEFKEGMLTPTNFVQSTPNAIAAQVGLLTKNTGYNTTHVHRGLSFENALTDADMLLKENPEHHYIVGGLDEISAYNYNIDFLGNWYKKEAVSNKDLYRSHSISSMAGEGAAMFSITSNPINALATLTAIHTMQASDEQFISDELKNFLKLYVPEGEQVDLLLSGENGDSRMQNYYTCCESVTGPGVPVARFKHLFGEYATVTAAALWLACELLKRNTILLHLLKYGTPGAVKRILIYNTFRGLQHSFLLVEAAK